MHIDIFYIFLGLIEVYNLTRTIDLYRLGLVGRGLVIFDAALLVCVTLAIFTSGRLGSVLTNICFVMILGRMLWQISRRR